MPQLRFNHGSLAASALGFRLVGWQPLNKQFAAACQIGRYCMEPNLVAKPDGCLGFRLIKLDTGPWMVLVYFSSPLPAPSNTDTLGARGAAASHL